MELIGDFLTRRVFIVSLFDNNRKGIMSGKETGDNNGSNKNTTILQNGRNAASTREVSIALAVLGDYQLEELRDRNRHLRQHIRRQNSLLNTVLVANARQGGERIDVPGILEVCNFCYRAVPPGRNGGVCVCGTVVVVVV